MGRVRTKFVKRNAEKLISTHKGIFTAKFEDNKKLLAGTAIIPTKKLRNLVAGYITKRVKIGVD